MTPLRNWDLVVLVDDEAFKAFEAVRAAMWRLLAHQSAMERRDKHGPALDALHCFNALPYGERIEILRRFAFMHRSGPSASEFAKQWPSATPFFDFCNLQPDNVKTQYRLASKICHPDTGGSNDAMRELNECYAALLDWAAKPNPSGDAQQPRVLASLQWIGSDLEFETPEDAANILVLREAEILLDDYAADHAEETLRKFAAGRLARESREYLLFIVTQMALILAQRWKSFGFQDRAEACTKWALELAAQHDEINPKRDRPYYRDVARRIDALLANRTHFVVNHERQLASILRLGICSALRRNAIEARLARNRAKLVGKEEAFWTWVPKSFLRLPGDPPDAVIPDHLPDPNPAIGIPTQDGDWAYHEAFYRNPTRLAVRANWYKRLQAITTSVIMTDNLDTHALEIEVATAASGISLPDGGGKSATDALLIFLHRLNTESEQSRAERLRLLRRIAAIRRALLEDRYPAIGERSAIGNTHDGLFPFLRYWPHFRDHPLFLMDGSVEWLCAAAEDLSVLRRAVETGFQRDPKEIDAERKDWKATLGFIQRLDKRLNVPFSMNPQEQPEETSRIADQYIRSCLRHYKRTGTHCAAQYQVGYYYDRKSVADAKLRKWRQIVADLEEFFSLPDAFRSRSSATEINALRKRLDRARRQCMQ